jgi:hypothetical protein
MEQAEGPRQDGKAGFGRLWADFGHDLLLPAMVNDY